MFGRLHLMHRLWNKGRQLSSNWLLKILVLVMKDPCQGEAPWLPLSTWPSANTPGAIPGSCVAGIPSVSNGGWKSWGLRVAEATTEMAERHTQRYECWRGRKQCARWTQKGDGVLYPPFVIIFQNCCNKIPQPVWLEHHKHIVLHSGE